MYQVELVKGGPLSGRDFQHDYEPGVKYTYANSEKDYIEKVIAIDGHFEVAVLPDPEPTPEEKAAAEAVAKAVEDASKAEAEAFAKAEAEAKAKEEAAAKAKSEGGKGK